jgi:hypothetical protein
MAIKKILIFNTAQVVDLIGGSQASLEDAILNFLDNDIEVIFISYQFNSIINYNGPNLKRIFIHRLRNNPLKFFLDIILALSFILFRKFDYIWANSALPCFIFMPLLIAKNKIYTFHGPIIEEQVFSNKSNNKISLTKILYKFYLNYFNILHYNTNYVKNSVQKEYPFTKKYDNYTSEILVNDQVFKNKYKNLFKQKLYENKLTVLIPRRLVKRTGVLNFIKSINILPLSLQNNFKFLITGDGPEKNNIIESIKDNDNFIFLGLIPEEELNQQILNSDIICIPSIAAEGFCLPARHAMILDKFVLHTGQGGLLETTNNYYKSMLYNHNDIDTLKIQFENIIHFDKKHYSENSNTKSYEFKLENLFKNLYE